jgi:uncharacterized protein
MIFPGSIAMHDLLDILTFVVTTVWHVLPVFLFSVFLGVLVQELKVDRTIREALSGSPTSAIFTATAIGAFSPFCSCTVIPVVNGLLRSGVPLAPVMAFWISSPLMDPEIFTLSVALMGWPLSIARLASTFILSLGAGFLTLFLLRNGILPKRVLRQKASTVGCCSPSKDDIPEIPISAPPSLSTLLGVKPERDEVSQSCCAPREELELPLSRHKSDPWWQVVSSNLQTVSWPKVLREVLSQSLPLGGLLVLAFTLEALIDKYVPQATIASFLGNNNAFSVPLSAIVGIPLYLNNVTALPIIDGLLDKGMQPGAAIAFLIAGPVTTIPAMTAVWGVVQPRIFGLYLGIGLFGAILLGFATNILFSQPLQAFIQITVLLGLLGIMGLGFRKFLTRKTTKEQMQVSKRLGHLRR